MVTVYICFTFVSIIVITSFILKYIFSLIFLLFISCKKNEPVVVITTEDSIESLALFDEKKEYQFNVALNDDVKEKIKSWDEYFIVSRYLEKNYLNISPSLSLEMSKELPDLVQSMNDSLQITSLNNRGVFARLHTLKSEVIRLKDMSSISSIKASEVTLQVAKVVAIYNSINAKINAVYAQYDFDEQVHFDEEIFEFNTAAETPYSVPKKRKKAPKSLGGK